MKMKGLPVQDQDQDRDQDQDQDQDQDEGLTMRDGLACGAITELPWE